MRNLWKATLALSIFLGINVIGGCSKEENSSQKDHQENSNISEFKKKTLDDLLIDLPDFQKKPYKELPFKVGGFYCDYNLVKTKKGTTFEFEYNPQLKEFFKIKDVRDIGSHWSMPVLLFMHRGNELDSIIQANGNLMNFIRYFYVQPSVVSDLTYPYRTPEKEEKMSLPSVRWGIEGISFFDTYSEEQVKKLFKKQHHVAFPFANAEEYHTDQFFYMPADSKFYLMNNNPLWKVNLLKMKNNKYMVIGFIGKDENDKRPGYVDF